MTSFISQNWLVALVALASGLMLLWPLVARRMAGADAVGPTTAVQMLNRQNALLLDIREAAEVEKKRIAQARHIALPHLLDRVSEIQKFKDKPVILVGETGGRVLAAAALLRKNGFTQVRTLEGGIQAWEKAGLPLSR